MKIVSGIAVGCLLVVGMYLVIVWANQVDQRTHSSYIRYYSACEYLGSRRITSGGLFGGTRAVYAYRCDDVVEEASRKWHVRELK